MTIRSRKGEDRAAVKIAEDRPAAENHDTIANRRRRIHRLVRLAAPRHGAVRRIEREHPRRRTRRTHVQELAVVRGRRDEAVDRAALDDFTRPDDVTGRRVEDGQQPLHRRLRDDFATAQIEDDRRSSYVEVTIGIGVEAREPRAFAGAGVEREQPVLRVADADKRPSRSIDRRRRPHSVAGGAIGPDAHHPALAAGRGIETEQPPGHERVVTVR